MYQLLLFPSPIGELHFSILSKIFSSIVGKFPSPIGELHFSIVITNFIKTGNPVSVPYRGATFLNHAVDWRMREWIGFPSPIGELHFSIFQKSFKKYLTQPFPSPIGELHFSILTYIDMKDLTKGFRPLSGSYISQSEETRQKIVMSYCFRPLSGSYISQFSIQSCACLYRIGFRPLSGSYISQSYDGVCFWHRYSISVPYRGATFLNHLIVPVRWQEIFPSPIGELHFSMVIEFLTGIVYYHFRPLSGSYISQSKLPLLTLSDRMISVPYRGATFLNHQLNF